jgi:uncharacterized protein (DUF885 family)
METENTVTENNYKALTERFHELMSNPFSLVGEEDFSRADELPDISLDSIEDHASRCLSLAEVIDNTDVSSLPVPKQLDLEMARDALRAEAMSRTVLTGGSPRYNVEPEAIQAIAGLTTNYLSEPTSATDIIDSFLIRMEQLPEYLSQELSRLDTPVEFMRRRELDTASAFDEVLAAFRIFAEEKGYKNIPHLNSAIERASAEVKSHISRLSDMPTRKDYNIGYDAAARWFRLKGITLSLEEIHEWSQRYLQEVAENLEQMKPRLIRKHGLNRYADFYRVALELKESFEVPPEEVIAFAQEMSRKAQEFAYSHGIVVPLRDAFITVEECPAYLRPSVPVAAMSRPGAFAEGTRKGTFLINPREGVGKALNRLNMPTIASHELVPGHMYQLARAPDHPSIVRKWLKPRDLCEGWATLYAEQGTAEAGFTSDPGLKEEEDYMRQFDLIRLGARANFVLAGLTGEVRFLENPFGVTSRRQDMFETCSQFYERMTGFSPGRARGDVEIFAGITYGALYLVGNTIMREMESQARAKQGNKFSLPQFLEHILQKGNMPLSYMQRELQHDGIL